MSEIKLMNAKGVRDFLPEEAILRQEIIDTLRKIFEKYGYSPLETPAIERKEVLEAKFAGGAEILKEIFKVEDQGGRNLALRYDLTVPLAKVIGMNPNLPKPFKRYQIQPVWRDGPIKLGRYREFMQCDVDIIGSKSMIADAEVLAIAKEVFDTLGIDVEIKVNSRKLMNGLLEFAEIKENKMEAILTIDKLSKIGVSEVKKELESKGFEKKSIEKLMEILSIKDRGKSLLDKLEKIIKSEEGKEGIKELRELYEYCELMNVEIVLDISLARGLEYYTGPVFEVYGKKTKVTSSLAGGGRYDKMIGMFIGKGEYPATGISFGLEPIFEILKERREEKLKTVTKVFVIPIGMQKEAIKIVYELRKQGIKADIDLMDRGISANLSYANSLKIPYVLFVGKEEVKSGKFKLRDMKTGEEKYVKIEEIKNEIK
ncbi:MAG: histidine--tRNA ligase [Candidatus Aenigmatarchaeota archaeon]